MEELSAEELQAILGTDYETVLADILRRKGSAEERGHGSGDRALGQAGNGHVAFDPGTALFNWNERRKGGKEAKAAGAEMQGVLDRQDAGRKTFAQALTRPPAAPAPAINPDALSQTVPQGPPPGASPAAGAPPMAQTAPTGGPPPNAAPMASPSPLGPPPADPGPRGIPQPPVEIGHGVPSEGVRSVGGPGPRPSWMAHPQPTDMSNRINRDGNEVQFLIDLLRKR